MAIVLITSGVFSSTDGNGFTTSPDLDTTGANFIILSVSYYPGGGAITIADSKSNTWHTSAGETDAGNAVTQVLSEAYSAIVGSGHNWTLGGGTNYPTIAVAAFSGVQISPDPLDQTAGSTFLFTTTFQPGSVTPGVDNELIVSGIGLTNTATTLTIDGGFSTPIWADFGPGAHQGGGLAYLIQTSLAAANPTWTLGASGSGGGRNSTFKVAPSSKFILIPGR